MYDLGSVARLTFTTTDASGNPANAGLVQITLTLPDQTTVGPTTVTPGATGSYEYDYTTVQSGRHAVRWLATGANAGAYTDVFDVYPATSGAIVSLADAKLQLNLATSYTTDDAEIRAYIQSATDVCNRKLGYTAPTTVVETVGQVYSGFRPTIMLSHTPILSITSVTAQMQSLPTPDLTYQVINSTAGTVYLSNWWPFYGPLTVTYVAGRTVVPAVARTACLLIVDSLYRTQRGGGAVVPGTGGDQPPVMVDGVMVPAIVAEMLEMSPYNAAPGLA